MDKTVQLEDTIGWWGCLEHLCLFIGNHLATWIIGNDLWNDHWEWSFKTLIDIQSMQDNRQVRIMGKSTNTIYHYTYPYHSCWEQLCLCDSQHIWLLLWSLVTYFCKKCSSDQTVTPLIKKWSDWRLRRHDYEFGTQNLWLHDWYVTSEALPNEWIIYWIELDSTHWMWPMELDSKHIGYVTQSWISEDQNNSRKMPLVTRFELPEEENFEDEVLQKGRQLAKHSCSL